MLVQVRAPGQRPGASLSGGVGVLGGVFNPPHIGHLVCACEALETLGLDRVALVPVRRAPHRAIVPEPGPETRLALCTAAIEGFARLEVSSLELERNGPSYTADTLQAMHDAAPDEQLTLILGGDQALALRSWREPERVLELARLAVAERGEARRERVEETLAPLLEGHEIQFFEMPPIEISSTLIRQRIAAGREFRHLVSAGTAQEIDRLELYRDEAA